MTDYNGFSWYDIDFNDAEKFIDVEQAVDSMKAIMKSIDNLKHHYQLEKENQYDGIFRNGILTYAMITYPEYFQKIACLSAYPEPKSLKILKAKKKFSILDFYFSWNRRRCNPIRLGKKSCRFLV